MTNNLVNLDLNTCENLNMELTLEKRLEEVIAVWESDSNSFEKLDCEIDLENEMFTVLNELESKNLWRKIEKLDRALQCQPKRYKECNKYISQVLIPLYLAEDRENSKEQKSRIEDYLKPFYEYPEESCEILFNVLDKLICYDQSSEDCSINYFTSQPNLVYIESLISNIYFLGTYRSWGDDLDGAGLKSKETVEWFSKGFVSK